MTWRCKLGLHRWLQAELFVSGLSINGKVVSFHAAWAGYQCRDCGKRKVRCVSRIYDTGGAQEKALDWLNEQSERPVLELVKRDL